MSMMTKGYEIGLKTHSTEEKTCLIPWDRELMDLRYESTTNTVISG